jgi:hypothetical protein
MASILKVDTIQDQSGNNIINENADTITIGASGDTITIPSGATLTNSGTLGAGMGKILQVVEDTSIDSFSTSSLSVSDTNYSITITPSSASSKIIVIAYGNWGVSGNGRARLQMASNSSGSFTTINGQADYAGWGASALGWMGSIIGVEPTIGTTSAVTYKLQAGCISSGITWYVPIDNSYATMIAYEIAG